MRPLLRAPWPALALAASQYTYLAVTLTVLAAGAVFVDGLHRLLAVEPAREIDIALAGAAQDALRRGHAEVRVEHFVHAALFDDEVAAAVATTETTATTLRQKLDVHLSELPRQESLRVTDVRVSPPLARIIQVRASRAQEVPSRRMSLGDALDMLVQTADSFGAAVLAETGIRFGGERPPERRSATGAPPRSRTSAPYRAQEARPRADVVFWNDSVSTMEGVLDVLQRVFAKTEAEATHLMLSAHHKEAVRVGTYPLDEAVALVEQATAVARDRKMPLRVTVEAEGALPPLRGRPSAWARFRTLWGHPGRGTPPRPGG